MFLENSELCNIRIWMITTSFTPKNSEHKNNNLLNAQQKQVLLNVQI